MKILPLRISVLASASLASSAFGQQQPDFSLADVNPGSVRGGQTISPRDYRQQISVYYFGREW